MQVGLTEAAKMTGKDPSTITRAVNNGKLSASQDAMGSRVFDIAELQRVYGTLKAFDELGQGDGTVTDGGTSRAEIERIEELHQKEVSLLREQIRLLERQTDDLRTDRDRWQVQAGHITRLLTDQSGSTDRQRDELIKAKEEAAVAKARAELVPVTTASAPPTFSQAAGGVLNDIRSFFGNHATRKP